jgi:heterogeneous nuclear rnp K-like protein 2
MIHGVHERILSVSGPVDRVAKAFSVIARHFIENPTGAPPSAAQTQHTDAQGQEGATIKLLVDTHLMGSIIGRGGDKIRDIQSQSGAKIIIGKDMLAQSTERVVEIYGITDSM